MSAVVEEAKKVWTEAELQALPHDAYHYELVNGDCSLPAGRSRDTLTP